MDPIEQQIRDAFESIPFGDGNLLDQNVIYSLALEGTKAEAVLVIGQEEESLINQTTAAVEKALLALSEIEEVGIRVVESYDEAEAEAEKASSGACGCGNSQPGNCGEGGHHHDHGHHHHHGQQAQAPHTAPQQTTYLNDYEFVVLVASGKGGVGKSTTAVNLALALHKMGKRVSMLDADIYGPSLPAMMGARGEYPEVVNQNIQPLSRYGIEFMSIGSLVEEEEAMIWRGPMAHQAMEQLLRDTTWPGGDYMIIDLPPGTGDVQITLAQKTQAVGALIVCTPQDVALLDARKAISMFDKVNIPILGMVENMSFFKCPNCGEETPIFSSGGAEDEAISQEIPFLGKVPIELAIRRCGDDGTPIVEAFPESPSAKAYMDMARELDKILNEA